MHGVHLQLVAKICGLLVPVDKLVDDLDVPCGDDCRLLTWVRDLRNRWNGPIVRLLALLLNATVVAISDGVDASISFVVRSPSLTLPRLDSKCHIHKNPTTASWPLLTQGLFRHEIIRRLHTDANVLLVDLVRQLDLPP